MVSTNPAHLDCATEPIGYTTLVSGGTPLYYGSIQNCNAGVVSTNPAHLNCSTWFIAYSSLSTINVSSGNSSASWTITGPETFTGSGASQTYVKPLVPSSDGVLIEVDSIPTGTYTISWNSVAGYAAPPTQSLTLANGETISFTGTYVSTSPTAPVCSTTHYSCSSGASANNSDTDPAWWTWSCVSQNGGGTVYCSETKNTSSAQAFSSVTVTVAAPAPCNLPWGGSISSGSSATAYQASSVNSPATCVSEMRTCNNGALSGSYANQNCTVICSNGANNPPACNQCPNGFAFQGRSCVACSGNPPPTGCTGTGGGSGNPLGSLVCINGATNPINCNAFPPARPVITSFSASPATVDQGQPSTISWSSNNATSCTGTGFTAGGPSGSRSVGPLSSVGAYTYQLICSGIGGDSSPSLTSVTVLSPSASISASPTRVHVGTPSQITWSASQVRSCTISGPGLSRTDYAETPTSQSVAISSQSIFTITCQTNGGQTVDESVTVNVIPTFNKF